MDGERDPASTPGSRSSLVDASVAPVILEVVDFSKSFGPVRAVRSLSLDVRDGEVHAICGHNGAGKSTLVKALVGLVKPDEGVIRFDGEEISLRNPHDAQAHGIALVNQELSLVPELSVEDNIFLGGLDVPLVYRRRRLSEHARSVLDQLGLRHVQLGTAVESLSIGERQLVEIARLLVRDARLLILDEPTATLSKPEIERVFKAMRDLVAQGRSVIFVSHRLDEVFELCDRVTVLRDGQRVATHEIHAIDRRTLIENMLGEMEGARAMVDHEHVAARVGRGCRQDRAAQRAGERRRRLAHARERSHHGPRRPGRVGYEHDPPRARRARAERLRDGRSPGREGSAEHAAAGRRRGRAVHPERPAARRALPRPDGRAQPDGRAAPPTEPARRSAASPDPACGAGARHHDGRLRRQARLSGREPQRRQPAEGAARPRSPARGDGAAGPRRADARRRRRRARRHPQPRSRGGPQRHCRDLLLHGARRGPRPRGRRRHDLPRANRLGRATGRGVGLRDPRRHDDEPCFEHRRQHREHHDGPRRHRTPAARGRRHRPCRLDRDPRGGDDLRSLHDHRLPDGEQHEGDPHSGVVRRDHRRRAHGHHPQRQPLLARPRADRRDLRDGLPLLAPLRPRRRDHRDVAARPRDRRRAGIRGRRLGSEPDHHHDRRGRA